MATIRSELLDGVTSENLPERKGYRPVVRVDDELERGDTFWGLTWQAQRSGAAGMLKR